MKVSAPVATPSIISRSESVRIKRPHAVGDRLVATAVAEPMVLRVSPGRCGEESIAGLAEFTVAQQHSAAEPEPMVRDATADLMSLRDRDVSLLRVSIVVSTKGRLPLGSHHQAGADLPEFDHVGDLHMPLSKPRQAFETS